MKKSRINISSALRAREESSGKEGNKISSGEKEQQERVREVLEKRRQGHSVSIDELRNDALESGQVDPHAPPKRGRVRLSAQSLTQSDPSKGLSPSPRFGDRIDDPPTPLGNFSSRRKCRDAIHFKSDIDYQNYLLKEREAFGLYQDLYDRLKVLYVSRKNIPALMSLWDDLEEMGMDSCDAHLERAETLRKMDEIDKALLYLEKAHRVNPQSVIALRSLTIAYKLVKDYELAIHWGERWRQLEPSDPECSYQLGAIHHRALSHDIARGHLKRALQLDPSHLTARSLLESIGFDD